MYTFKFLADKGKKIDFTLSHVILYTYTLIKKKYQFDISSIGVLILAAFANTKRLHKLSAVDQFVMMYGGLRGAVAFALVLLIDKKVSL